MESYGQVLFYAIPSFTALILLEYLWGLYKRKVTYRAMDTLSSLSSGITNVIKDVLSLTVVIISYEWVEANFAFFEPKAVNFWWYAAGFIAIDFASYWIHRLSHEINVLWNRHIVHHSSEEFNLACALRQSISGFLSLSIFFLFPAALLGVPGEIIAVLAPFHLFAQYWYHTQHIGKLGFLEYIIVTPSQHRVHHAINKEYLDRNYAAIFCIWDRMFGSFQEELNDVAPVYGVKRQVKTWNPILINFQHLELLARDSFRTKKIEDKIKVWFKPTGWRPDDVAEKYPITIVDDPYAMVKYDTPASKSLIGWTLIQMFFILGLMFYLFLNLVEIGTPNVFIYGGYLIASVFTMSVLMDRIKHAWWLEGLKSIVGLTLMWQFSGWFGIGQEFQGANLFIGGYFILSVLVSSAFVYFEFRTDEESAELITAT
ncbi:MAG: alkylglycerol monooxygenase [Limisphaerales bacterium]|jgi:alkylglycerol monooxygenase